MTTKRKWLLSRKNTLSGSNIAGVVLGFAEKLFETKILEAEDVLLMRGQPCYLSLYSIWLQMRMDDETYLEYQASQSSKFTQRGQKLEEEIKNKFLHDRPEFAELEIKEQLQEIRDINDQKGNVVGRISATLDYKIGADVVLECKSTNDFTWNKTYGANPYFGWVLQLQMQMMLSGAGKGYLAVLVGKDEPEGFSQTGLHIFEYAADEKLQNAILYASYFFFTSFNEAPPAKDGTKKEEEMEEFLRKKQEAVRLETTEENGLSSILLRKKELLDEIEITKKYLAEIEIESKELDSKITTCSSFNPLLSGVVMIYHNGVYTAKLEYRKHADSLYTEEDVKKIRVGAVKKRGSLVRSFIFMDEPKLVIKKLK